MSDLPVILVAGLGRCGTSLVMQMLDAGGVRTTGEWPAFEDSRAGAERVDAAWLARQGGAAVKILDPQRSKPTLPAERLTVWLERDLDEQAASQIKFVQAVCGVRVDRSQRRMWRKALADDVAPARAAMQLDSAPSVCLTFESLIADPWRAADAIREAMSLWWKLDVDTMANCRMERRASCYPGLLEAALIDRGRASPSLIESGR